MNKKQINKNYEKVLDLQHETSIYGKAAKISSIGFLIAMLPVSFAAILSLNYYIVLLFFGGFWVSFSAYIIYSVEFSKLEILELYYITLLKRKNNGQTTKRSTRKV